MDRFDVMAMVGLGCAALGMGLIYAPLGLIVLGVGLIGGALLVTRGKTGIPSESSRGNDKEA